VGAPPPLPCVFRATISTRKGVRSDRAIVVHPIARRFGVAYHSAPQIDGEKIDAAEHDGGALFGSAVRKDENG
jgi:hypothetical protein